MLDNICATCRHLKTELLPDTNEREEPENVTSVKKTVVVRCVLEPEAEFTIKMK